MMTMQIKKGHGGTVFAGILLLSLSVLTGCGSYKYPFEEDFEKGGKTFDVAAGSTWGVAESHAGWETFRGVYHLDNNLQSANQGPTSALVKEVPQAGMDNPVQIPKTAKSPILSFWVKCNLQAGDEIYVNLGFLKKKKQKAGKWIIWKNVKYDVETLKIFSSADNTGEFHKWIKIPLDTDKDQVVLIWFRENMPQAGPGRVFVVDDFRISDLPTQDTDKDGIPDPYDPTPNNEKLPAVIGFTGGLTEQMTIHLAWETPQNQPLLSGYRLYRLKQGDSNEVLLNNGLLIPKNQNSFEDSDVALGQTYTYRLVAVSKEGHEGPAGDAVVVEVEDKKGDFPFEEDFEGAQVDFDTAGDCGWGVAETHGDWTTFDGLKHLDNQSPSAGATQNKPCAVMSYRIPIPAQCDTPVLTFWYKAGLNPADQVELNVHYFESLSQGGRVEKTDKIKVFTSRDNTGEFQAWLKVPLDEYKNKEIRVGFDQVPKQKQPDTVFTVDEFRISPLPKEDSDNDGIPDAFDPTPHNEKVRAVPELRAQTGKDLSVEIAWAALREDSLLAGYRLYRRKQGETQEVLLNPDELLPADIVSFRDDKVWNATGYTYRLASISKEGREGVSATAFVYVAYNLLPFPYEESFDNALPEFVVPKEAGWAISKDHGAWKSFSGNRHLDSNPLEETLQFKWGGHKQIQAVMKKRVHIPEDAAKPMLSFWYHADLQLWLDWIYLDIHYIKHQPDGKELEVIDRDVRVYKSKQNTAGYVWEAIPLEKYKGTEIWVSFRERSWAGLGPSVFVLDDFRVSQPSNNDTNQNGVPDEYETPLHQDMLPFVEEFSAGADENGEVLLQWKPLEGIPASVLAGYNLYRRKFESNEPAQKINPDLITPGAMVYNDQSGENNTAYSYHMVAVSNADVEGYPSLPAAAFVAFNRAAVEHLTAAWAQGRARLTWDKTPGLRYKIFRSTGDAPYQEAGQTDGPPFVDNEAKYVFSHSYRAAGLREFTNPISGVTLVRTGPLCDPVLLSGLAAPQLEISKAQLRPDGVYVLDVGLPSPYAVEGTYKVMTGPVTVRAVQTGLEANGTGDNGSFAVALPAAGIWRITVKEANGWMSSGVTLELIVDNQAPVLEVDGANERATGDDLIRITGTAGDEGSGLDQVFITSNRYPGQSFGAVLNSMGAFNGQVPLRAEENLLTVTARDKTGNKTEYNLKVTLAVAALPVITILSPANGAIVKEDRITISGRVRSTLPPNQIRLLLNNQLQFPSGSGNEYEFSFSNVPLIAGFNNLEVRAETKCGTTTAKVSVEYRPSGSEPEVKPPKVELANQGPDIYINQDQILIKGSAESLAGIQSITVDGQSVDFSKIGDKFSFESVWHKPTSGEGVYKIVIVVTDKNGKSTTIILNIYYDASAPQIILGSPSLSASPAVNEVEQNPLELEGLVLDGYLAGFSLNDKPVNLAPQAEPGHYSFRVGVPLILGQQKNLVFRAWDLAGNYTSNEYLVTLSSTAAIEIIAPRNGTEVMLSDQEPKMEVVARISGVPADAVVEAVTDDTGPQILPFQSGIAKGSIVSPTTDGTHRLHIVVRTANGVQLGRSTIEYKVINADKIALSLVRQEPANGSKDVEPNEPINFYFNKPIEAGKLAIIVKETAHGSIYDLSGQQNADLMSMSNIQLVEVHRDMETVPGGISLLPDKRTAAFYAGRDFAYNGKVLVEVRYDDKEVARTQFEIRALPTFIMGNVADQNGTGIANIEVYLKGSGRKISTSEDGGFSFGFGEPASRTVPPGRYEMVVNPGLKNRSFGALSFLINVEEGKLNRLGMFRIPLLNPQEPFRRISSGQAEALLAAGELNLDLSGAALLFPDGRDSGDVHVQFLLKNEVPYNAWPGAIPHWVFSVQPAGIEVKGAVGLSLTLPALYGSYDYIPKNETPVVLIGFDTHTKAILPIGAGRVRNGKVVSAGKAVVNGLDYFGVVFTEEKKYTVLEDFIAGRISVQQMMQRLEE